MKTIFIGLKNWKTTLVSFALAIVVAMQSVNDLSNVREWLFPALIAVLGIVQRDADKSSESSGIVQRGNESNELP